MKRVEFVQLTSEMYGYGFGKGLKNSFVGIEETIKERIETGWEYCGYVPIVTRGTGDIETLSLIFQKDE